MKKIRTFFILSDQEKVQLKNKYFQVTPNVCFCDGAVVMLKSDGTVCVSQNGKSDANKWTNITKICSGDRHVVGLKSDGSVVALGDNTYHQCDVSSWTNVRNIFAKDKLTVGITNNDEMLITGSSDTYSDEMNIIEQNALKLSNFIQKTENDIKRLSKQIDDKNASVEIKILKQISDNLDDFMKKTESDLKKLSNQTDGDIKKLSNKIDKQGMDTTQLYKDVDSLKKQIESIKGDIQKYSANNNSEKFDLKKSSDNKSRKHSGFLIECPKCKNSIVNNGQDCPFCGYNIKNGKTTKQTDSSSEALKSLKNDNEKLKNSTESNKSIDVQKQISETDILKHLCYGCMKENNGKQICPYCGFDKNTEQTVPYLALGTKLKNGNYIVGRRISTDCEGAKYMAYSINDKSPVIICEFMPAGISGRSRKSNMVVVKSGFESRYQQLHDEFFRYYSQLKKLNNLYPIEHVIDVFDENNNSYAVEEAYEEIYGSIPLTKYVEQGGGSLEWQWHKAITLFMPLLDTLSSIHEAEIGHYAIAPSNLVVTNDGKLRLKNFGIKETRRTGDFTDPNIIDGCAAPEQYQDNGVLDESTDVYGFTATLFYALTGDLPKSADLRKPNSEPTLAIPSSVYKKIPSYIIKALSKGLSLSKAERIQTFEELRTNLSSLPNIDSLAVNTTKLFEYVSYRADGDEVCLTNYNDNSSEIAVPSEINNKVVKALSKTFQNCKNLKIVVIPDSVNFIGEKTFYGCRILRDVYIPHSVMSIADDAFGHCDMRLTIHGEKGSYAERYAKQKHLKFIEMI